MENFYLEKICIRLLGLELAYSFEDFVELVGEICADGYDPVLTYPHPLGGGQNYQVPPPRLKLLLKLVEVPLPHIGDLYMLSSPYQNHSGVASSPYRIVSGLIEGCDLILLIAPDNAAQAR